MPQRVHSPLPEQLIIDKALRLRALFARRRLLGWGPVSNELTLNRIIKIKGGCLCTPYDRKGELVDLKKIEPLGLVCQNNAAFTIFLPRGWTWFMVAKQLGHYFLHLDKTKPGSASFLHREQGFFESESALFASSLLMPPFSLVSLATKYKNDAAKISSAADVPLPIVRSRLYALRNAQEAKQG